MTSALNGLLARFLAKVDKTDSGCWLWTGATAGKGYGVIWDGKRQTYAHRVSYELFVGPIPEGHDIDHTCHNHSCVNPGCLEPSTHLANLQNRAGLNANNTSGVRGVDWRADKGKWRVRVKYDGREYSGGHFSDLAEAKRAATALRARFDFRDTTGVSA